MRLHCLHPIGAKSSDDPKGHPKGDQKQTHDIPKGQPKVASGGVGVRRESVDGEAMKLNGVNQINTRDSRARRKGRILRSLQMATKRHLKITKSHLEGINMTSTKGGPRG